VEGLKNRLVIIVQNVVKAQDRHTIRDMTRMVDEVKRALRPLELQWGVEVHEFGFSTFSPTPETLEIAQLRKLANEKLALYRKSHDAQKHSDEAAVALIAEEGSPRAPVGCEVRGSGNPGRAGRDDRSDSNHRLFDPEMTRHERWSSVRVHFEKGRAGGTAVSARPAQAGAFRPHLASRRPD
jgi:hypothetical protein